MKLSINQITRFFGLLLFANLFLFDGAISEFIIVAVFGACAALGIRNRTPNKPYTYGRGLLIGFRILILGIIYSLLFLLIVGLIKVFIPLFSGGNNLIGSVQVNLTKTISQFATGLPSLIVISIISLVLILIIPLFFLQKSKQTDDIIDADLMNNE